MKAKSIREFDNKFSVPNLGYRNAEHYYYEVSSFYAIKDIAVPTLFIHSLDDPVCIKECIPFDDIKENPNCMMIVT